MGIEAAATVPIRVGMVFANTVWRAPIGAQKGYKAMLFQDRADAIRELTAALRSPSLPRLGLPAGLVAGWQMKATQLTGLALAGVSSLLGRRLALPGSAAIGRAVATKPAGETVLLVGAAAAGISALKELRRGDAKLRPVGFIDDDPRKQGRSVRGMPVLGTTADLPRLVRALAVDHVVITLATASRRELRRIVEQCEAIPVKVRVVPALLDLLEGTVETTVRATDIEGLLGREPVALAQDHLTPFLAGKRVLVTGAGGSIGSELCRQVARFAPERLVLVERCEFALWAIERELRASFPRLNLVPRLVDVGETTSMREVFAHERPQVVVHAAAYKHVPLVESNPCEAIKNNIFGTRTTAELAGEYGAESFVLVSTDKAVRPTSMMGATKRVAELVVQQLGARFTTNYIAVRFGNVLGSTGSVVPIFREQIARGGPVTITHPDMVRFFMTIPEAAQLVLQAGSMQAAGEIFVLDMGEPVRIVDLATNMIKQCGLKPEDIEIVFSGIRPGEKMYEELSTDEEVLGTTRHPKILSGKLSAQRPGELDRNLDGLATLVGHGDEVGARRWLARMLPESQLMLIGAATGRQSVEALQPATAPRDGVAA